MLPRRCVYAGSEPVGVALLFPTHTRGQAKRVDDAVLTLAPRRAETRRAVSARARVRKRRSVPRSGARGAILASLRCTRGDPCHALARNGARAPGKPPPTPPPPEFPQVAETCIIGSRCTRGNPCHSVAQIRGCVLGRALLVAPSHRCGNGHVNAGAGAQQRRRLHAATQTLARSSAKTHHPFALR